MKLSRNIIRIVALIIMVGITGTICFSQEALNERVSLELENGSMEDALWELGEVSAVSITFNNNDLPINKITYSFVDVTLKEILKTLLADSDLEFNYDNEQVIIFKTQISKFTISGYVEDQETGERLIGASLYGSETLKGTTSNIFGFYSLTLSSKNKFVTFSYLGYESQQITLSEKLPKPIIITLVPKATLPEIIVTDQITSNIKIPFQLENNILTKANVKLYPSLGGQIDILRFIQQIPGAQTGTDGIGGLNIRGGNSDQNLVLLDGAAIYNPYHTLGLFSIFDFNAIRNINYLRGHFPARYGGRLSSVIDIRTKDGNTKKHKFQFSTGLLSSRASIEGPILKNELSYFLSARRTHIDPFIKKYSKSLKAENNADGFYNYAFGEFTGKLSYNLSKNDRIYLSLYKGFDNYENQENSTLDLDESYTITNAQFQNLNWGNSVAATRWNHIFGDKVFSNLSLSYSRFNFNSDDQESTIDILNFDNTIYQDTFSYQSFYRSQIDKVQLKYDVDIIPNTSHYIRIGTELSRNTFEPGVFNSEANFYSLEIIEDSINQQTLISDEWNFYIEDEWNINNSLSLNAGIHNTVFFVKDKVYVLPNPRLSLHYDINKKWGIHSSLAKTSQNLHVLTRSGAGFPTDLWVPSTKSVGPKHSWLMDLGMVYKLSDQWNFAIDGYLKKMSNLIDYKESVNFGDLNNGNTLNASNWEENVTFGSGKSKGIEVLLKKDKGRSNLWISYTLSKTTRQFEAINKGNVYPFRFDHRHNLSINAVYKITDRLSFSSTFNYNTGSKTNIPRSKWQYIRNDGTLDYFYYDLGPKNNFQLPDYHRLNVEMQYQGFRSWGTWAVQLGIYNVYNRRNLYLISTDFNPTTQAVGYNGTSLIPFLPYFSASIEI